MASFSQLANQGKNAIAAFDTKQLILLDGRGRACGRE